MLNDSGKEYIWSGTKGNLRFEPIERLGKRSFHIKTYQGKKQAITSFLQSFGYDRGKGLILNGKIKAYAMTSSLALDDDNEDTASYFAPPIKLARYILTERYHEIFEASDNKISIKLREDNGKSDYYAEWTLSDKYGEHKTKYIDKIIMSSDFKELLESVNDGGDRNGD